MRTVVLLALAAAIYFVCAPCAHAAGLRRVDPGPAAGWGRPDTADLAASMREEAAAAVKQMTNKRAKEEKSMDGWTEQQITSVRDTMEQSLDSNKQIYMRVGEFLNRLMSETQSAIQLLRRKETRAEEDAKPRPMMMAPRKAIDNRNAFEKIADLSDEDRDRAMSSAHNFVTGSNKLQDIPHEYSDERRAAQNRINQLIGELHEALDQASGSKPKSSRSQASAPPAREDLRDTIDTAQGVVREGQEALKTLKRLSAGQR